MVEKKDSINKENDINASLLNIFYHKTYKKFVSRKSLEIIALIFFHYYNFICNSIKHHLENYEIMHEILLLFFLLIQ